MEVLFTGETDVTNKVGTAIGVFNRNRRERFRNAFYGEDLQVVTVFLVCRPGNFKPRNRYFKDQKKMFVDVILSHTEFVGYDLPTAIRTAAEHVMTALTSAISKRKFKSFDLPKFATDIQQFLYEKRGAVEPPSKLH